MGTIYAAIVDPDQSPSTAGAKTIAGYRLEIDDEAHGRAEFYAGDAPKSPEHVAEVIALDDDCVAKLLAQAVAKLKSEPEAGEIDEPPLDAPTGKWLSAGVVLVDEAGYVTIREPANHYGGVVWSYAKGRIESGDTPQQTAHRELREETGLTGRMLGLIGDFEGGYSLTRFYVGVRTGGEEPFGPETWTVRTVSPFTAMQMLNQRKDRDVLVRLVEFAAGIVDWSWTIDGRLVRCRLVDGHMVCSTDTSGSESRYGGPTTQAPDGRRSSPIVLSDRFERALQFAAATHRTQVRKGSGVPYVAHLLGVCSLVIEDGGSEDEAIAALLHDAAEDCGGQAMLDQIKAGFGKQVAAIVEGCTDTLEDPKPDWWKRKQAYIEHLGSQSESVLRVSLADKLFNARAILRDYLEVREELWTRFKSGRIGQLWYYRQLADQFETLLPERGMAVGMAVELRKVVAELGWVAIAGHGELGEGVWDELLHPSGDARWIDTSPHAGEEYRALRVNLPNDLPKTVNVGGHRWERRPDPHVTLFDSRRVRLVLGEGDHNELIKQMAQKVSEAPVNLTRIGPPWRAAKKADRRSLVVSADVEGVQPLYHQLSQHAGCAIPPPPLHVTVYTAPGTKGIGLTLPHEWKELTRPLTERERADLEALRAPRAVR